jgi:hypothetical protein
MAIVAYYITESWKYQEVLLGFEPLHGAHTGRNLAQVVERVLLHFGIADRLFAITTDNASNNSTLRESLEQALMGRHNISWNAEATKINCLAHVLNLSAKALLLGVKVPSEEETSNSGQTAASEPCEVLPDVAEISVANTVVKVRVLNCHTP